MERRFFGIILLTLIAVENTYGFNLDLTMNNAKIMTSPVLDRLGKNAQGSIIPVLDPSIPPSFYGQTIDMMKPTKGDRKPKLVVGAPRMTDPDFPERQRAPTKPKIGEEPEFKPKGSVDSCPVTNLFSDPPTEPVCSPAHPPPSPGDGLGSSIAVQPNGDASACSLSRAQECTIDKFNPGFCFTSGDYGKNWDTEEKPPPPDCPQGTVDVLFVLDGSGSVHGHFDKVKDWVKKISEELKSQMEKGIVQIGVVQYSHWFKDPGTAQKYIKTEIEIGKYTSYAELAKGIDKIRHQNYTTYTGHALEKVRDDFKESSRFSNKNNKQVMFLMTDGQSKDSNLILPNANYLRSMGVKTFAVGVGDAVQDELRQIATGNTRSKARVYSVDGFSELDTLVDQLQAKILNFVLEGSASSSSVSYQHEFGQTGFSSTFDKGVKMNVYMYARVGSL